jgi:hypothetical protein
MLQFLKWESEHNLGTWSQGVNFKSEELPIPYFEIDISGDQMYRLSSFRDWYFSADRGPHGLTIDFAEYLPKDIAQFFKFERDGKTFIRWPMNPLDQEFRGRMSRYFDEIKLPYRYFSAEQSSLRGFRTASKSVIVQLPGSEHSFSFKTGTSTVGQREGFERPNPSRWAHFNRKLSDYYHGLRGQLKTLEVAWEAGAIMLPPFQAETDNSLNIRLMEAVSSGERYQMTGFVLHDKKEIARLAKLAKMTEAEYRQTLSRAFGSFLVELNLVLGFRISSAHLQNVRFELDRDFRPTGKVILLDLTDGSPVRAIFEKNGQASLLEDWRKYVGDTWVGTEEYTPNKVIETPVWIQSDMRDHFAASAWFGPMDKAAMREGAEERLRSLGSFSGKVSMRDTGDLVMKFDSAEDLYGRYRKEPPGNCHGRFMK